jgi:hypothetical protein
MFVALLGHLVTAFDRRVQHRRASAQASNFHPIAYTEIVANDLEQKNVERCFVFYRYKSFVILMLWQIFDVVSNVHLFLYSDF